VDAEQERISTAYIAQLEQARLFRSRIVTRLDAFQKFHQADLGQQDFMIKNPRLATSSSTTVRKSTT
jgi:peptide-methionine (S)-S-oxide reductase